MRQGEQHGCVVVPEQRLLHAVALSDRALREFDDRGRHLVPGRTKCLIRARVLNVGLPVPACRAHLVMARGLLRRGRDHAQRLPVRRHHAGRRRVGGRLLVESLLAHPAVAVALLPDPQLQDPDLPGHRGRLDCRPARGADGRLRFPAQRGAAERVPRAELRPGRAVPVRPEEALSRRREWRERGQRAPGALAAPCSYRITSSPLACPCSAGRPTRALATETCL